MQLCKIKNGDYFYHKNTMWVKVSYMVCEDKYEIRALNCKTGQIEPLDHNTNVVAAGLEAVNWGN